MMWGGEFQSPICIGNTKIFPLLRKTVKSRNANEKKHNFKNNEGSLIRAFETKLNCILLFTKIKQISSQYASLRMNCIRCPTRT